MGTTSNQSYPYPEGSSAVDVPGDIQALADAVDSDVAAIEANDWVTTARINDGAVTLAKMEAQYAAKSAAYTLTAAESVIDVTGTTTVTLPTAASHTGRVYIIRNTGTNTVTVSGITNLAMAGKGSATVVSDGSAWSVISASYVDESVGRRVFTWNPDLATPNWQMTYGDTGWRDVSAGLLNSWSGTLLVRRQNDRVTAVIKTLSGASTFAQMYTLPAGFGSGDTNVHGSAVFREGGVTGTPGWMTMAGSVLPQYGGLFSGPWSASHSVTLCQVSWSTAQAWPTSLPGSASGSIPS